MQDSGLWFLFRRCSSLLLVTVRSLASFKVHGRQTTDYTAPSTQWQRGGWRRRLLLQFFAGKTWIREGALRLTLPWLRASWTMALLHVAMLVLLLSGLVGHGARFRTTGVSVFLINSGYMYLAITLASVACFSLLRLRLIHQRGRAVNIKPVHLSPHHPECGLGALVFESSSTRLRSRGRALLNPKNLVVYTYAYAMQQCNGWRRWLFWRYSATPLLAQSALLSDTECAMDWP
ncbi:hypothetical protein GGI35DRAFT_189144 [Trichoderma velutinum]